MVDPVGNSSLAREALRAAQRLVSERTNPLSSQPSGPEALGVQPPARGADLARTQGTELTRPQGTDFARALESGVRAVDRQVQVAESMPLDLISGKIEDFHEIAVQLKSAELSFKFAMEIRNKLVDAYREIMRMNV